MTMVEERSGVDTPEQAQFRAKVQAFLSANCRARKTAQDDDESSPMDAESVQTIDESKAFQRALVEALWPTCAWTDAR